MALHLKLDLESNTTQAHILFREKWGKITLFYFIFNFPSGIYISILQICLQNNSPHRSKPNVLTVHTHANLYIDWDLMYLSLLCQRKIKILKFKKNVHRNLKEWASPPSNKQTKALWTKPVVWCACKLDQSTPCPILLHMHGWKGQK